MKPKNVKISSSVSDVVQNDLKMLIGVPLNKFMIGGNFGIYGNLNEPEYKGDQINMCFDLNGDLNVITFYSRFIGPESFEEYDDVFIGNYSYGNSRDNYIEAHKDMLVRNRGIFYLNINDSLSIESIEVYGVFLEDYLDLDEDLPDEVKRLWVDIDLLFKFNTGSDSFFTLYAKEGKILLRFYKYINKDEFDDFIKFTKNWGPLSEIKKKYTID